MTAGDFVTTTLGSTFRLVYLLRNTITNLTTQDEQVDCFRNVASHLEPGGVFVIENYIPEPHADPVRVVTRTPTHLGFEEYDRGTSRGLEPLLDDRRRTADLLVTTPLPLARGAGPHGPGSPA